MSDEKTLKKIEKERESILFWLDSAERDIKKLRETDSERKKEKYKKSLEKDKRYINLCVENVIKYRGTVEGITEEMTSGQIEIWRELYSESDTTEIATEKEIQRIKKLLHEELKKAMEKDDYNADDPIEVKMKNKRFEKETYIGYTLEEASEKTKPSGSPNPKYNANWNYVRDYEETKDKYFTPEEQELLKQCVQSRAEEREYIIEKRGWMIDLGGKLIQAAEKMEEGSDIRQAKSWAKNLYEDVFPVTVKEIYGKLPKKEIIEKSKAMTQRYIEFLQDPEKIENAKAIYAEAEAEAEVLLDQLNGRAPVTSELLQNATEKELKNLRAAANKEIRGQNMLAYYILTKKMGLEHAWFIGFYRGDRLAEERKRLLTKYSLEELGL